MRLLFLNFGEHSGVVHSLSAALRRRGVIVSHHDVSRVVGLRGRTGGPNLTLAALLNMAASLARFGRRWRAHLINTPFAFDRQTAEAGRAVRRNPADVVLQCGALFAPGRTPLRPYVLYLDHTRAISEAYPPAEGLCDPVHYGAAMRARETAVYQGAAAILTMSEFVALSLARDYTVPPSKIRVVGAGANVLPAEPRRTHDGRTILFVGRDFARKGGHVLLRAFRAVRRHIAGARLRIVGPPRLPQKLLDQPGVEFLGPVPLERMPDVFAEATVFTLPTLREPFGLAFLDAMACGVPCVGTEVEAVPEIVEDCANGLLVRPGDEHALARALIALLAQPLLARALGEKGRARVQARFTWDLVACRMEETLRAAAGMATPTQEGAQAAQPEHPPPPPAEVRESA